MDDIIKLYMLKILVISNLNISPHTIKILNSRGMYTVYNVVNKLNRYEEIEGISDREYKQLIDCINESVSCIHISNESGHVEYIDNTKLYKQYFELIESAKLIKLKDLKVGEYPFDELFRSNGIENLYHLLKNENLLVSLATYENGEYIGKLINKVHNYGYKFSFELKEDDVLNDDVKKDEIKKRKYFNKIRELDNIDIKNSGFSRRMVTIFNMQSVYNLFELLATFRNKDKFESNEIMENNYIFDVIEDYIHQKGYIMFYEISSKSQAQAEKDEASNMLNLSELYCNSIKLAKKIQLKDLHICYDTNRDYYNQGINTVEDLLVLSKEDFENMPTITKGQFEDIIKRVHEAGFLFKWDVDSKEQLEEMSKNVSKCYECQQEFYRTIESAKYIPLSECGINNTEMKCLFNHGISNLFDIIAIENKDEYESKVEKITTVNNKIRIVNKIHILGYKMFWEREPVNPLIVDSNEEKIDRRQVLNSRIKSLVDTLSKISELNSNKQKNISELEQKIEKVDSKIEKSNSYNEILELNIKRDDLLRQLLNLKSTIAIKGRLKSTINSELDFESKEEER